MSRVNATRVAGNDGESDRLRQELAREREEKARLREDMAKLSQLQQRKVKIKKSFLIGLNLKVSDRWNFRRPSFDFRK